MDIQRWLRETTDREPPANSQEVHIAAFPPEQTHELERNDHTNCRKRKRREPSDDSSVITPWAREPKRRRQVRDRTPRSRQTIPSLTDYSASRSDQRAPRDLPAKSYERRPRHKTRPDRYEPKAKKVRKERTSRREKHPARAPRKSRRGNDGDRTKGIVQSFQLKNGPKNSRLTLKPDTSASLFKHGRASMQMVGRGKGLPDLVFNEMKFLKTPREHQDEVDEIHEPQHTDKKERKRKQEEDISAYFTANKGATLVQADATTDAVERNGPEARHTELPKSTRQHGPSRLVDLPGVLERDLDGNGIDLGGQHADDGSKEYYSWSDSMPGNAAEVQAGRPKMDHASKTQSHSNGIARLPQIEDPDKPNRNEGGGGAREGGRWVPISQAPGGAVVERYQAPNLRRNSQHPHQTSATGTTLQSLPRQPSTKYKSDPKELHVMGSNENIRSSYRTSDILDIGESDRRRRIEALDPVQMAEDRSGGKENIDPVSSFDELLSQTNRRFTERQQDIHPRRRPEQQLDAPDAALPDIPRRASHRVPFELFDDSQQAVLRPTRDNSVRTHRPSRMDRLSNVAALSTYPEAKQDELQRWMSGSQLHPDDADMLDDAADQEPLHSATHATYAPNLPDENFSWRESSRSAFGIFEAQAARSEASSYQHQKPTFEEDVSANTPSTHGPAFRRDFRNEQSIGALDEDRPEFTWKPHRLY